MKALDMPMGAALGSDGIYHHEGALIAVKPRLNRVSRLFLNDEGTAVTREETLVEAHPDFVYPTTGVLVGDRLVLVATSYADRPRRSNMEAQHGDVLIYEISLP